MGGHVNLTRTADGVPDLVGPDDVPGDHGSLSIRAGSAEGRRVSEGGEEWLTQEGVFSVVGVGLMLTMRGCG